MNKVGGTYPVGTARRGNYQFSYADLNRNQKYDRGDYVILSHTNNDRKLDEADAYFTSRQLHQMRNRRFPDLNGDGKLTANERVEAARREPFMDKLDSNMDGRLTGKELTYRPKSRLFGIPKAFRRERYAVANDYNNDGRFSKAEIQRKLSITALNRDSVTIEEYSGSYNPFARRKLNVVR